MTDVHEQVNRLRRQGSELINGNRLAEAKAAYTHLVDLAPEDAEAWYALSNINGKLGLIDEVEACCRRAIALRPDFGEPHINLGHVYLMQGKPVEALAQYQAAVKINPAIPAVYFNMGNILRDLGRLAEAIDNFRKAIHYSPSLAAAHNNLGKVYFEQGATQQAATYFQNALELDPLSTQYLNNFGMACRDQEQFLRYLGFYRKAVETLPDPSNARRGFIGIIDNISFPEYDAWLDRELGACYSLADVDYRPLTYDAAQRLKLKYGIEHRADDDSRLESQIKEIGSDNLFILYLEKSLNVDATLELFLTSVRRKLLLDHYQDSKQSTGNLALIRALAHQGANNEYVFSLNTEEQRIVDDLRGTLENGVPSLAAANPDLEQNLCVYGMYDGLNSLTCRELLAAMPRSGWSQQFLPLFDKTLMLLLEEERIKSTIESIGMIEDQTSRLVQAQYEENPYPRWLSLPVITKTDLRSSLAQIFPMFTPPSLVDGRIEILIAGCGTGKHPILEALRLKDVDILGVDISKASLAYAIRMARKFGASNIRFLQGDILKLSTLKKYFPVIQCSGVLHHMQNPLAGWKVLSGLLMKGGLMKVGLYSEIARRDLNAARDAFKCANLEASRENIRKHRNDVLMRIARGDISRSSLLNNDDFYSTSGCRDLLFHVQEHRFTIPQISNALAELDMKFIGFTFPPAKDREVKKLYLQHFPADREMANLTNWDQFEKLYSDTFSFMYQFWCQKN